MPKTRPEPDASPARRPAPGPALSPDRPVRSRHPRNARAIIILIAICLTLGLTGIRWGLPDAQHEHYSFHPDESPGLTSSLSVLDPSRPLFPTVWAYEQGPFFFDVAALYLRLVSLTGIIRTEQDPGFRNYARLLVAARLLVVLLYCGVVLLVFGIVRRMWGNSTGFLAALLTSVSPALVTNAHYFKNDIPLAFAAMLTLLFALRILETGRTRDYVWAGILCGITTAVKYHGFAVAALPIAAHYLRCRRQPKTRPPHRRLLLALVCAIGGFLIAVPGLFLHPGVVREGIMREYARRTGEKTASMLITGKDSPGLLVTLLYGIGIAPVLAVLGSLLYLVFKKRDVYFLLLLPFTLAFLLLLVLFKASYVRYLVPLAPFLMIPVARTVVLLGRKPGAIRTLAVGAGTVIAMYALLNSVAYLTPMTRPDPRIAAADWLACNAPAQSRITVETSAGEGYTFIDPQQYHLQQVYETREGNNRDTALLNQTDFYVASEAVYRKYLRQLADLPRERAFYQRLMNSSRFQLAADFADDPALFGLQFNKSFPPPDLMYILPRIRIYRKVS
jgi:hypothetical protein